MKAKAIISSSITAATTNTVVAMVCICLMHFALTSCEREPDLHLHSSGTDVTVDMPKIDLELNLVWNYLFDYDTEYDWQAEWLYGWDETDELLFGHIGYTEPTAFDIRRYFNGNAPSNRHSAPFRSHIEGRSLSAKYEFGFWDFLAWSSIVSPDGIQSVRIDEESTYDYVTALTGQTMSSAPYNAPAFTHSFYQPEQLFAGYETGIEVNKNLDGFVFDEERNCWVRSLEMMLQPVTYIYLLQVVLHNNHYGNGKKVTSIDGMANFSGMARSVTLNSGITGTDAITVSLNMRMKTDRKGKNDETVDIIGGKAMTFGIPGLNPHKLSTRDYAASLAKVNAVENNNRHYLDVTMQFVNGKDSTLVFDITDQVRRLYRGGVITVELDMEKVPLPYRSGGSGFDAVVKDFEEKEWEIEM